MRLVDVLMRGMRVHTRQHVHAELPAAGEHLSKGIATPEELAAVVQRNPGGIERHAPAGAEARGVGMDALEVIEPEARIVTARVVLDESQLHPPHGPVAPAPGGLFAAERRPDRQGAGLHHPFAPVDFHKGAPVPEP